MGLFSRYHCLVMDQLGASLEDVFNFCQRKFSMKTVLLIVDQLLSRIEYIHSKNFLHRDVRLLACHVVVLCLPSCVNGLLCMCASVDGISDQAR